MLKKNAFYLYIPSPPFILGIPQVWELALNSSVCFLISPEKQLLSRASCVAPRICVSGRFYFGDHHSLAFFYPTSSLAWSQHTHRVLWFSPIWAGLWRVLVNVREGTLCGLPRPSHEVPLPQNISAIICVCLGRKSHKPQVAISVLFVLDLFYFHLCTCACTNVCVFVQMYVHMHVCSHRSQKRAADSLKLEIQVFITWMLGCKLWSSWLSSKCWLLSIVSSPSSSHITTPS